MSTSDQDQDRDQRKGPVRDTDTPIAETPAAEPTEDMPDVEDAATTTRAETGTTAGTTAKPEAVATAQTVATAETVTTAQTGKRLTPRQARQLRIVLSSVGMVAMGVVLALRIASRSSVLVVGVYGLALILCGLVIELSRNGRTRLGSWLLGAGLVAAVGADWLLLP
ncbi:hypothetical protein PV390_19710 [Streptomyces sp. ME02-6991-2A]|uniref:hypothetical protein n=1 Tax=Streptomyces sp. ME02-6991-2A TaxID=3028677 RepID=UPI0010083F32|nr:hypothetical protein [Streptomyces sp. ME02-6991-2A]MDX3376624.1 hypothetical protein [Streptomyces sp. ME02-6991-2A]